MEVQVARVDAESLSELAVRHRILAVRAEHLEHAKTERMAERLQLLGSVEREDVRGGGGGGRHPTYI